MFVSENKENKQLLQDYLTYQRNQWKMNTSTKFNNISISEKAKNHGSQCFHKSCENIPEDAFDYEEKQWYCSIYTSSVQE